MNDVKHISVKEIYKYATGDVIGSLVINSIATFALLYYTGAVGLSAAWAGLAISISIFWDAISDPIVGYLSDNTKSKYGRRHPWMFISGIALSISFYFIWAIPDIFRHSQMATFYYLVAINLMIRTFLTGFFVPFNALAYDICTDYNERTTIQGVKMVYQMAANFLGPGLAWAIFFPNANDVNHIANFEFMGAIFSVAIFIFVIVSVFFTKHHIIDSTNLRGSSSEKATIHSFIKDTGIVFTSRNLIIIFIFAILFQSAAVFMATMQQYVYQYVLTLSGFSKSVVNGGTMLGAACGSFISGFIAYKIGKTKTNYIATALAIVTGVSTAALLISGLFIDAKLIRIILFATGNIGFWFAFGITMPVISSMIADTSEVHYIKTGINQEGIFGAIYSLAIKGATSLGILLCGLALSWSGFISGSPGQTASVLQKIILIGFVFGPAITLVAAIILKYYTLSKEKLESIRNRANLNSHAIQDDIEESELVKP